MEKGHGLLRLLVNRHVHPHPRPPQQHRMQFREREKKKDREIEKKRERLRQLCFGTRNMGDITVVQRMSREHILSLSLAGLDSVMEPSARILFPTHPGCLDQRATAPVSWKGRRMKKNTILPRRELV